jgi:hypothetical protein
VLLQIWLKFAFPEGGCMGMRHSVVVNMRISGRSFFNIFGALRRLKGYEAMLAFPAGWPLAKLIHRISS